MTAFTPVTACPSCGGRLNAAIAADGSPLVPSPGDVSVCLMCSAHLVFDEQLLLRPARPGELPPGVVAALDQAAALCSTFRARHADLIERERRGGRL